MRKGKIAKNTVLSPRHLDKLIEEATVDCYNEEEQATGFFTMIEENLALPFATRVLGVEASVVAVEMDDDGGLEAVCERGGERQRIGLTNLISDLLTQPMSGDLNLPLLSCRWRHLGADYPRWLNGETACTLRNSGSSSSEISRMLARAVDNGMPAQWVRTTM